ALRVDGNTTPLAEFNFYVDPHAASIVLHSGMPITLLPWDITKDILLTQKAIDQLLQIPSPVSTFIADATRFYIDFHLAYFGFAGCSINDPAALALVFRPDLATTTPLFVDIEITSEVTMGKTVGDFRNESGRPHNIQLVTAFDSESFVQIFVRRMGMLADRIRVA
ncbi:MAG: nucleoside hydrolase, partial [Chloroflexota bacterium]